MTARWQSGYAADCKSVDIGSIPVRASNSRLKGQLGLTQAIRAGSLNLNHLIIEGFELTGWLHVHLTSKLAALCDGFASSTVLNYVKLMSVLVGTDHKAVS